MAKVVPQVSVIDGQFETRMILALKKVLSDDGQPPVRLSLQTQIDLEIAIFHILERIDGPVDLP